MLLPWLIGLTMDKLRSEYVPLRPGFLVVRRFSQMFAAIGGKEQFLGAAESVAKSA